MRKFIVLTGNKSSGAIFGTFVCQLYILPARECVRNLNLRVQVHPEELWVSKSAGAHSTRSLKISGCKRWYPKDLRVRAPAAPALTHSLRKYGIYCIFTSKSELDSLPRGYFQSPFTIGGLCMWAWVIWTCDHAPSIVQSTPTSSASLSGHIEEIVISAISPKAKVINSKYYKQLIFLWGEVPSLV